LERAILSVFVGQLSIEPSNVTEREIPRFTIVKIEFRVNSNPDDAAQSREYLLEVLAEPEKLDIVHTSRTLELDRRCNAVTMFGIMTTSTERL
jgi:hypothetical protein